MMKTRILSIVALLLMAATGAVAQTETLLTTITGAGSNANPATSANVSYSTEGVATLSFSGQVAYQSSPAWGWWRYGLTITVNAAEGYTITKCIFYDDADRTATDSEAPFVVATTEDDKTPRINDTPIDGGNNQEGTQEQPYKFVSTDFLTVTYSLLCQAYPACESTGRTARNLT